MIRLACRYEGCDATALALVTPETHPARLAWGKHAGAQVCVACGRHQGWVNPGERDLVDGGELPAAALRFVAQLGRYTPVVERWARAALDRGVPGAPPIQSNRDLVDALEVATTLPGARSRANAPIAQRLRVAIGDYRAEARSWAAVILLEAA